MLAIDVNEEAWGCYALPRGKLRWLAVCQKLKHRRLNLWVRHLLKRSVRGWVDTTVWGLRLRLASEGNLSEQRLLYSPRVVDSVERHAIRDTLQGGGVFVDIGANAGVYSFWAAAQCGAEVTVEAFEPDPQLCARLESNLRRNNLDHVRLHAFALGEADGTAHLIRGTANLGCNQVSADDGEGEQITIRRLPGVLRSLQVPAVDVLKIDVEGGECSVLRPLFEELPHHTWPRLIVCELAGNPKTVPVTDLLLSHGYHLERQTRMNGLFRRERGSARQRRCA